MNHTLAMQHLLNGSVIDATISAHDTAWGIEGWFLFAVFLITIIMAYIRTRNISYPIVISVIFLAIGAAYLPAEAAFVLWFFVAFAIAGIVYKVAANSV